MLDEDSDEARESSVESISLDGIVVADTISDERRTPPQPVRKKKARTTFEIRQREELQRLRGEVDTLKAKLSTIKTDTTIDEKTPFWRRMAHDERVEKIKAFQENEALREAVDQRATFIDQMRKTLLKKPRLLHQHDVHSEEWQTYRIAATASLRYAAIHAIADRQLGRLNHAFLRAGLLGLDKDTTKAELIVESEHCFIYQIMTQITLAVPRDIIATSIWRVLGGSHASFLPFGITESYEQIDASTVYSRVVDSRDPNMTWHSNLIRKLYSLPDKDVVVIRAVLDDALVPQMANDGVEDKWAWAQVTRVDEDLCRLSLLVQVKLTHNSNDRSTLKCARDLMDQMNRSLSSNEDIESYDSPLVPAMNRLNLGDVANPSVRFFLENSKRIRDAISTALNQVLETNAK
ncbi:unnamed protein product [Aphanomyces euteiches]|uniref:START domain-containing protein n=1 Tax=Aphanomyces euteiches TaxID=100861 RepID=A0A6G0X7U6_9STRA|nr:hypothetical protein Ae201684_007679 [Aphanomyces euteiches]KAH9067145.1 hypothetical protein Ae201684P_021311 [Aphanomyces euteiches]KAH9143229.1 hypothetical protein AeRB84_012751 [Aphanomyces euteiches]